jgi:segregation and condensation protein B
MVTMDKLDVYIESLVFATEYPVPVPEIISSLQNALEIDIEEDEVIASLDRLVAKYKGDDFAFEIVQISGGFQFMTKGAFHHIVGEYLKQITQKRLSRTALETLSIIAYKQPVTKPTIEQIRGVNSDYSLQKLLEKNLIEIVGRDDGPGRPLIYATSSRFMDYFGLKSMKDLPELRDFQDDENSVGVAETLFEEE